MICASACAALDAQHMATGSNRPCYWMPLPPLRTTPIFEALGIAPLNGRRCERDYAIVQAV